MSSIVHRLAALSVASALFSAALAADDARKDDAARAEPARSRAPADYVLQPEDVLRVQVFQEDDINKQGEVRISQEHTIFLPLIKIISLKGKTVRQAEDLIRDLYNKDFLVNPQVSVAVIKYAERSVSPAGTRADDHRGHLTGRRAASGGRHETGAAHAEERGRRSGDHDD
jgi:Polysaccharide biosynthesis/export protein